MPSGTRFAKPTLKRLYGPAARRAREAALDRVAPASREAKTGKAPTFDVHGVAQEEAEAAAYARGLEANKRERTRLREALRRAEAETAQARAALERAESDVEALRQAATAAAAALREGIDAATAEATRLREACAAAEARADALAAALAADPEAAPAPGPERAAPAPATPLAPAPAASGWIGGPPPIAAPAIVGRAIARPSAPHPDKPPPTGQAAPPPRPTPPQPDRVQAALGRGRVSLDGFAGALLLQAPPPGGRAARCFAELLDRAAARFVPPPAEADDEDAPRSRHMLGAVRHDRRPAEDLRALACLYREADALYRTLDLPPSGALPLNGEMMRTVVARGGSAGQACVEAGHA